MDLATNAEKRKRSLSTSKWRGYRMTYHKVESRKQDRWSEIEGLAGMNYEATASVNGVRGETMGLGTFVSASDSVD